MKQPLLIPGETFASPALPPVPRSSRLLRIVVVGWMVAGLAFLIIRFGLGAHSANTAAVSAAMPAITAISSEDLLSHMDAFDSALADASAKLLRAEGHIARALPGVERNYLLIEKNRLDSALAMTEAVRRDLEERRRDFAIIRNSIKKEHQSQ